MAIGLAYSRVIPGIAERGDLIFGVPAIQRLMELVIFPARPRRISRCIRWRARPGWERWPRLSICFPSGSWMADTLFIRSPRPNINCCRACSFWRWYPSAYFYWRAWLVWAALLFFFALRHPVIFDVTPLDRRRVGLGILAAVIFLLTFTVVPIH